MTPDTRFYSRRSFCGLLLAGCGLAGCRTETSEPSAPPERDLSAGCDDPAALPDDVRRARAGLGYVDEAPVAGMRCDTCQFWLAPEDGDAPCGRCVVLPGPVRAAGTCNSWAPQTQS